MVHVSNIGHSESALYIKCKEVEEETSIISCAKAEFRVRTERPPTHTTTDSTKMVLAPVLQYSDSFFIKGCVCVFGGGGRRMDPAVTFGACTPPPTCKYKYVGVYRNYATTTKGRDT